MKRTQAGGLKLRLQVAVGLMLTTVITAGAMASDVPSYKDSMEASVTATVQAIDLQTREVTLKNEAGNVYMFVASPEIKRLDEVKIGDVVKVGYRISVAAELREPTAAEKENPLTTTEDTLRSTGTTAPAGVMIRQTRAVTTIEALDPAAGTITVKGPRGRIVTTRVADKALLEKLQVGRTIVVKFTEDVAVTLEKTASKSGQ